MKKHIYPSFMQTGRMVTWTAPDKAQSVTTYVATDLGNGIYQLFRQIEPATPTGEPLSGMGIIEFIETNIDFHTTLRRLELLEDTLLMESRFKKATNTFNTAAAYKEHTHYSLFHPHVDLAATTLPKRSSVPVGTTPITAMLSRDGTGPEETKIKKKLPQQPRFRP